jgi:ABC-type transport system involved in cytochrome c biogenesis permease subunit
MTKNNIAIDMLIGVCISILATTIGSFVFIEMYTEYHFIDGIQALKSQGLLGKIITLGAILNLISFFILLKLNKEAMARGIVFGTILLTIITLFV